MTEYTADQKALLVYLKAKKEKTLAWIAVDPNNRAGGYPTLNLDHWASQGVFSIAQYERQEMIINIYELYKDVNGIRPRWMNFDEMSDTELEKTFNSLLDSLNDQNEREEAEEEEAIAKTIACGAGDRETALRWLAEAD